MAEGKQIASLFALLGFQIDDKNLLKFKLGMIAAVGAVAKFAADVVKATVDLDNFNKTTGISIDLVRDWQIIAEQSNVSADSITSAFESIAKMKGDLMAGKNIGSAWAMLGITGNEDPEYIFNKVLEELGKIKDINLRNTRIADLGFDPQLVNLIGKTRQSLDGIFKDLKLTEKERKNLLEVKKSFTDLRLMLSMLKEKFVALFFPVKMFIDLATRIYMIIYKVVDKTIGWENAIKILGIVFAGLLVIFAPITTAITLLGLVIDDLYVYFTKSGKSITAEWIEKFPALEGLLNNLKDAIKGLGTAFEWIVNLLSDGVNYQIETLSGKIEIILTLMEKVSSFIKGITQKPLEFIAKLKDEETDKENEKAKKRIEAYQKKYANVDWTNFNNNIEKGFQPTAPILQSSQKITIQQQNTFEINGVENPQATGNVVSNTLNDQINASVLQQQANN